MATHHRWWNDVFPNLYFDDRLWAHMIRGAEWLREVDRWSTRKRSEAGGSLEGRVKVGFFSLALAIP